jgi:large subunit ribosomal protein L21
MTYAIVKSGGRQFRVEEGTTFLVNRLPEDEGAKVALEPVMVRTDSDVIDGDGLAKTTVEAKVLGHERGPKIRVFKFKPKRGYKRTRGHRQELTRLEITTIKAAARRAAAKPKAAAAKPAAAEKKEDDS